MFALFGLTPEQRAIIIAEAMARAQQEARGHGLDPNAKIVHPDLEYAYRLVSVDNGIATLEIPAENSRTGERIVERKPYNELFDANRCFAIAMNIGQRELSDGVTAMLGGTE